MTFAPLRILCAGGAASAALWLGAWAGGALRPAHAQAGRGDRATDQLLTGRRDQGDEIPLGESLEVNGQPMQLSLLHTRDAPRHVVQFYADAFRARGVMPIVAVENDFAHVSGFDPSDGLQRFISALPQPDGQTLVILGATNPRRPPRLRAPGGDDRIPLPVEHRGGLSFRSSDQEASADTAQYASSLRPEEVLAFYRRELTARGFSERLQDGSGAFAVFAKKGASLSVAVQALSDKAGSAVFVISTSGDPQ